MSEPRRALIDRKSARWHFITGGCFFGEERAMTSRSLSALGLLLGVACVATQNTRAANVQFDGETSTDFTVAQNWADNNPPTADGDRHFIDNGLTADLTGTATVSHVVVGDVAAGTVNVNGGTLNIANIPGFPGLAVGSFFSNHTGIGTSTSPTAARST
jgi:hypothetical protein